MRFSSAFTPLFPLRTAAAQDKPRRLADVFEVKQTPTEQDLRHVPVELPQDLDQRVRAIGEW